MRRLLVMIAVLCAIPAEAQLRYRPSAPPIVTADNDPWYLRGEPVPFAGELYYPTGRKVSFNGNVMVRSGQYEGVPLYVDVTIEPYSMVLVPISGGLMRFFELPRRRALPGGSESLVSSTSGEISVPTDEAAGDPIPTAGGPDTLRATPGVAGTAGQPEPQPQIAHPPISARRPLNNDGVWLRFGGEKWVSAGAAIPFVASEFVLVGQHSGFPVFARRELKEEVIYLPARPGVIAPYRLKN